MHPVVVVAALAALTIIPVGFLAGSGDGTRPASPDVTTTRPVAVTRHATVLLVGDSLIRQAADGIRAALPDTTVIDGSVTGSGLLNGPTDWASREVALVARYRPDVVVVSFVGNYDRSTGSLAPDSAAFDDAWATAASRLTADLRARQIRVEWISQPPVLEPNFYRLPMSRVEMVRALGRQLATEAGVGFVDADGPVSAPDGSYTATHDVCGVEVAIRLADGVHFTTAGAAWWGANLAVGLARNERFRVLDPCSVLTALDPALG